MSTRITATVLTLAALAVIACTGGGGSTTGGATPTPTTAPSPSIEGIVHPTGANEIVLRFDESGGFVPPEFLAAHVPLFTLYGLGSARAEYQNPLVADAPTATFTLNADGAAKTVSVVALGMEDQELTADSA